MVEQLSSVYPRMLYMGKEIALLWPLYSILWVYFWFCDENETESTQQGKNAYTLSVYVYCVRVCAAFEY